MDDRRRHHRIQVTLPVILRHAGRIIPATAVNLSCGGMYIRADQRDIAMDKPVEVIFDLAEGERDVSLRGKITRVDESGETTGLGVQFTNLFSQSHKALTEYLNKHLN